MKPEAFKETRTGSLVPLTGIPGATHAFVPDPLPPAWIWPEALWERLLAARTALAELSGIGKHLPNPELLLRPLQNREAQKSSSIEGTYTDPEQQLLFEVDSDEQAVRRDDVSAFREVSNYGKALRYGQERRNELPLSLRLIRELHRILMTDVQGSEGTPGEFRKNQNVIGRPPRYVPPPANVLPTVLDDFEKYLHASWQYNPLVEAFLIHYQFEAIHPFMDGNGRVGRLLLSLMIQEKCELSNQWLYMSAFFDRNKDQYIDLMFDISTRGRWENWIAFCLQGVEEQARDTIDRCEKLISLNRAFKEKVAHLKASVRLSTIVDQLFISPVTTVTRVKDQTGVTYPTARSDLQKLEDSGILTRARNTSRITYYCGDIVQVIYAD